MLLAININNTETKVGLFRGDSLESHWRLTTTPQRTPDEWASTLTSYLAQAGRSTQEVRAAIVASVVPPVTLNVLCSASVPDPNVTVPPLTVTARKMGFTQITSFQDAGITWTYNSIDTTVDFAQRNPQTVLNFLRGFVEGIAYIFKNKEESLVTLKQWMRLDDREALDETYDYLLRILPKKPYASDKGFQAVLDALAIRDPIAKKYKPQDFIEARYLKELDQSGFLDRVFK